MTRASVISLLLALLYSAAFSQKEQWTVKAGESILEVLGESAIYRYPQFSQGTVHFRDGTISRGLLNFNRLSGEMEFIAPSKDTLALANTTSINYISLQQDTFYFDKVYIELVHGNTTAKLGKLDIKKVMDIKKEGAFGQMNSTSSITATSSFYSARQSYRLVEKTELTLQKETIFFIGDSQHNFSPANRKNISKTFSPKNSAIESFMKENKIELTKEEDLVKLIDFIGQK